MPYKHKYITITQEDHQYKMALRVINREIRKENRDIRRALRVELREKKKLNKSENRHAKNI